MLCVDVGGEAAVFLRIGDDVRGERRFSGRFRAEDFNDSAARNAADASAMSRVIAPVLITLISRAAECLPSVMMEPSPNCFSICAIAASNAFFFAESLG